MVERESTETAAGAAPEVGGESPASGAPDAGPSDRIETPAHEPGKGSGAGFGDGAEASGEGPAEEVSHELEELVAGLRAERDEYLDLARRAKADFDNYRRRATQQTAEAAQRGKAELARELLPAIDSLERALESADADGDALARGVALVRDQLVATLERAGVEAYDPTGERFDPAWHEAVVTRAEAGVEPGTVLETFDRGYRLDGQVLRPARVVVSE